jgi:hypothetical protein
MRESVAWGDFLASVQATWQACRIKRPDATPVHDSKTLRGASLLHRV